MIINNIPKDLFIEEFEYSRHLFSDDSLFIYGFKTIDKCFLIWIYDIMKNEKSIFKPELNLKRLLNKTFESNAPTPTTAHFVNEDIIILLFDSDGGRGRALVITIKLDLSRNKISLVDNVQINHVEHPVLLKEGSNFGIAFTHVQYEEKNPLWPEKEFAAYYPIKQENGLFLPLGDRIIFTTYQYQQPYDNFLDPHLFDNKLWFLRGLLKKVSGPCIACMRRNQPNDAKNCVIEEEPYIVKMQLSYFDLTKKYPRIVKFMVIENLDCVSWHKQFLFSVASEENEEPTFSIFDLTNKSLVHFKDTGELHKFESKAKKFYFGGHDRFIDAYSNVTMIDISKRQLLRVPLYQNSTKMDEAQCLMNKELVRISA